MSVIQCEVTPLIKEDLFVLLNNYKAKFDYPTHYHSDYELNLVMGTSGKRIVGDSVENFTEGDLVLIGPGVPHAWKAPTYDSTHVITIQFHEEMYNSFLLSKRVFEPIKELLFRSKRGIVFSGATFEMVKKKIIELSSKRGFATALDFYGILYDLSIAEGQRLLTSSTYDSSLLVRQSKSRRIEKICKYIDENYGKDITLKEIAELVNMSESAASHFFKKRTSRSFITYLTDVRIGNASRMLAETTMNISTIAYECGFSNMANFNRTFKKYRNQTPTEYRNDVESTMTKY